MKVFTIAILSALVSCRIEPQRVDIEDEEQPIVTPTPIDKRAELEKKYKYKYDFRKAVRKIESDCYAKSSQKQWLGLPQVQQWAQQRKSEAFCVDIVTDCCLPSEEDREVRCGGGDVGNLKCYSDSDVDECIKKEVYRRDFDFCGK